MHSCQNSILSSLVSGRVLPRCDYMYSARFAIRQKSPCYRLRPPVCSLSTSSATRRGEVTCLSRHSLKPQRVPHSWTAAQDAMLRQAHEDGLGTDLTCKTYFASLDISPSHIRNRRRQLGLREHQLRWTQADKELLRTASDRNMSDLEMVAAYFPHRTKAAVESARHRLHFDRKKLTSRKTYTVSIKKWSKRDEEMISEGISLGKSARTIHEESFPDRTYASVRTRKRVLQRRAHIEADALPDLASEALILSLHSQGLSINSIASKAEVSEFSVRQCLVERSIQPNKPQKVLRRRWTEVDIAKLIELDDAGTKASRIAKLLGRSEAGIMSRLKRLHAEDKSRSIDEEELKSAIEWHEKGASYSDVADRLRKRLHIVVTAMTALTGKPLGQPQATRPWLWGSRAKRADANQHSAPVNCELEKGQGSTYRTRTLV